MKRRSPNFSLPMLGALTLLVASGCNRDQVKVYHVETNNVAVDSPAPQSVTAPAAMTSAMPPGLDAQDNSGLPRLKYTLPDGWQEKPPSTMRVASFEISKNGKSLDVSVVPLGGMAGGDFANVNRWRDQLGQPPLDDIAIQKMAEKVEVASQPAELYDVTGATPNGSNAQRIIAAIAHRGEAVWFFKMNGDADLAQEQKPAFISFLKSVQFTTSGTPAAMNVNQLPPSHPPLAGMNENGAAAADKPAWTVPPDWQPGPSSEFLVAKYIIGGTGTARAEVNISSASGDGGGLQANVNRWRGQLGLSETADVISSPVEVPGGKASLVDFSGTDARNGQAARIIGVMVTRSAQTWFYKLMGDPDIVSQQRDALIGFVQSAKYSDAH